MSDLKIKIANLAAQQLPDVQIAAKLKITPSYLSQLKQDDEYLHIYNQVIAARRLSTLPQTIEIDDNYDKLEHKMSSLVLENAEALLANMVDDPIKLFRAMQMVNGMKRRGLGEAGNGQTMGTDVVLEFPSFLIPQAVPEATITDNNEVIAIGDKSLIPMSQTGLRNFANQEKEQLAARNSPKVVGSSPEPQVSSSTLDIPDSLPAQLSADLKL